MRRIVFAEQFAADLRGQVDYLRRRGLWDWIATLEEDLRQVEGLLAQIPEAGRELAREGTETLRKLRLRRAPFYVWYALAVDVPAGAVTLLRLFHTRQRTRTPRVP